jgi:hypothetical protein
MTQLICRPLGQPARVATPYSCDPKGRHSWGPKSLAANPLRSNPLKRVTELLRKGGGEDKKFI